MYSLQILRGIAALLVLGFHYSHYLKPVIPGADIGYRLFSGGYAGVDVFFIISGFIIVYSTHRKEHANPVDFSIRRLFRVVPLAQVATLAYFLIIADTPPARLLGQSLLFLPSADIDPPKFGYPVVPQEWTLSYELLFYGLFAIALALTHKRRVIVAGAAIVACVIGFQWTLGGPFSLRPNGVYLPTAYHGLVPPQILGISGNPIMLEFIFGMLLAVAYRKTEPWLRGGSRHWPWRTAGLCLVGIFLWSYFSRIDPGNGLLDKGGGAACLVMGALMLEASSPRPTKHAGAGFCLSVFLWIGAISYPLYLVHAGIAERLLRFSCSILFGIKVDGIPGFVALTLTSLLLASGMHVLLERKFIDAGKRIIGWRRGSAG